MISLQVYSTSFPSHGFPDLQALLRYQVKQYNPKRSRFFSLNQKALHGHMHYTCRSLGLSKGVWDTTCYYTRSHLQILTALPCLMPGAVRSMVSPSGAVPRRVPFVVSCRAVVLRVVLFSTPAVGPIDLLSVLLPFACLLLSARLRYCCCYSQSFPLRPSFDDSSL